MKTENSFLVCRSDKIADAEMPTNLNIGSPYLINNRTWGILTYYDPHNIQLLTRNGAMSVGVEAVLQHQITLRTPEHDSVNLKFMRYHYLQTNRLVRPGYAYYCEYHNQDGELCLAGHCIILDVTLDSISIVMEDAEKPLFVVFSPAKADVLFWGFDDCKEQFYVRKGDLFDDGVSRGTPDQTEPGGTKAGGGIQG